MSTPSPALGNRTPEQLKVTELREELKKRGIQIKGLKKDLVDRLEEVLKQEELEQQKELENVVEEDAPAETVDQPVTPVTKKRSERHDHHAAEEPEESVVSEPVLASEGTEITVSVAAPAGGEEPPVQEVDTVPQSVAAVEDVPQVTESAAETAAAPVEEVPVVESAKIADEQAAPALEDLVADLEQNFNNVVQEEPQVQQAVAEETAIVEGQAPDEPSTDVVAVVEGQASDEPSTDVVAVVEGQAPDEPSTDVVAVVEGQAPDEPSTDVVPAVEKAVDEEIAVTEEVISTTVEQTVTTTVEEQEVAVVPEDQTVAIVEEEQIVTTSTRIETLEESADEIATTEETITTVVTVETSTAVVDEDGVKLDTEPATILEGNSDVTMEEFPEDATKVADGVAVAETPKDEIIVDVAAGTEKASTVEEPKEETPMDVDADTQKGSKRKDAVDGELSALEPTKRRRWNSAKGEEDSKGIVKDIQPLELQEPVPSSNAPVPPAKVLTPKSAPPEKVAVTRTAPTRTEATVNGESQKSRVVPPSAKPATSSLKIDKFLRPFTFKAVKELLAQTGTVEDVWMDQIKTHCYVTYSSVEEATATRNALFNLQWPPQGGRLLTAEFVDPSEVKLRSDGEKAAAAAGPTATVAPSTNAITPRGALAANSKASKDGVTAPSSGQPSTTTAGLLPPPPPLATSPRDRPKQEVERTPTLDDLFRKTRSKPHIYYLPLTAQEVADKVAARNRQAATKPGIKA